MSLDQLLAELECQCAAESDIMQQTRLKCAVAVLKRAIAARTNPSEPALETLAARLVRDEPHYLDRRAIHQIMADLADQRLQESGVGDAERQRLEQVRHHSLQCVNGW